jgi:hypothetical protein
MSVDDKSIVDNLYEMTTNRMSRFWRYKAYFLRGHTQWTSYLLAMLNFITIAYVLLGAQIPGFYNIFTNIALFGVVFILVYFVLAGLLGRYDIKRGPLAVELQLAFENNPEWQGLRRDVQDLNEILRDVQNTLKELR